MLNEHELAIARRLLHALQKNGEAKPVSTLRRYLPEDIVKRIKDQEADFRQVNRSVRENASCLSSDAKAWWKTAQKALAYGRLATATGGSKREKALSRLCERLEETFDAMVPDNERGKFLNHDVDGRNWDDRWHSTVDFAFPLLDPSSKAAQLIANPKLEAQISILYEVVAPPNVATSSSGIAQLRALAQRD